MNTHSHSAYPVHGFPRHWSALDLADAVPLKLSERITLGLVEFATTTGAANSLFAMPAPRNWRRGYLRSAELPAFVRVR
ncbi:hypothetical protein ACFPN1_13475 [Lysobacter yangpyeongensis]|uniref:Uncharacterized protein n=1 Tax=Lysobacter yangpyeongensis TaxID=346182 RepID=A0ABW0SQA9_9GAMM